MGLPSKKRTSRSKRERGAHLSLKGTATNKCAKCGAVKKPHYACPKCGTYKGKTAASVEKRAARLIRKNKKK